LATPLMALSTPSTPTSRSRRQGGYNLLTAHTLEPIAATSRRDNGLFANMAFAVTFTHAESTEKLLATKAIIDNGAHLLNHGFDELFDVSIPEHHSTNKSAACATTFGNYEKSEPLRLKRDAQILGFTALIADRYCRRAKYMQALALDIPCLHYRWLTDSIAASKVQPFLKYLLPAGESAFLSGSVRSRSLPSYDPLSADAKLVNVLGRRQLLLGEKNVLLVMGKGKQEERRKAYLFLTYALGAKDVGRVRDLTEAKRSLKTRSWDWVYVDGDEAEAEVVLFSSGTSTYPGADKKRKRGDQLAVMGNAKQASNNVNIVGDEFVIQSLILGALMEL
jgi:DNA repair protein RAD9